MSKREEKPRREHGPVCDIKVYDRSGVIMDTKKTPLDKLQEFLDKIDRKMG